MLIKEIKIDKTPIEIFENFLDDFYPVFLDSQKDPENLGRYSIIASAPFITIEAKNGNIRIGRYKNSEDRYLVEEIKTKSSLSVLVKILDNYKVEYSGDIPFVGGAIGHFSYELLHEIENVDINQVDDLEIPDFNFGIYNEAVVIDNLLNKKYIVAQDFLPNYIERFEKLEKKIEEDFEFENIFYDVKASIKNSTTKEEYFDAIKSVKDNISCGNVYQINYTQRFETKLNKSPFTLFKRLANTNPAPFASYCDFWEYQIVSSSPERFIRIRDRKIDTRPIKGTIARGKSLEEDEQNLATLKNSKKDQSELLMIVDLERNDLGKISKVGSVEVKDLFHIEKYATVFQQVANVEGILKDEVDLEDVIRATFPGGSITGAPKIAAVSLIGELEKTTRNIYTGSIGYIGFNGNLDLNIVIRTVLCKAGKGYYQVGGGIVWDSDAQLEYEESILKGIALEEALLWRE